MKVSLNWIKQLTAVDLSLDELVEKIGAQLGAVEAVENTGDKYRGILVVEIMECQKHPNADKLSLCLVDDGGVDKKVKRTENGLIQVVCGAPNVKTGMLAAWIPPGATVPATYDKEPFVIEARPIRNKTSHGMLASAKELAIGEDHDGIIEIDRRFVRRSWISGGLQAAAAVLLLVVRLGGVGLGGVETGDPEGAAGRRALALEDLAVVLLAQHI